MNKLINQICRFILDGKYEWKMLYHCDKEYLINLFELEISKEEFERLAKIRPNIKKTIKEEIQKLVPCFFE